MTRPTIFGLLFLLVGLAIVTAVLGPVLIAIKMHAAIAAPSVTMLCVGLVMMIFGALLIPFSGADEGASKLLVLAGPYIPSFGRRERSGEVSVAPAKKDDGGAP